MAGLVNTGSLIHDTSLLLRDNILNNVTDPISGTRPSNSKFVLTSEPDRPTAYPLITLDIVPTADISRGIASALRFTNLEAAISVWSLNTKERDQLSDDVYNTLATIQDATPSGTRDNNLTELVLLSTNKISEPAGKQTLHRKILTVGYTFTG